MANENAQFESVEQAVREGVSTPQAGLVKLWKAAIEAADKEEEDWRKEGDEIVEIYRSASEQKKQQAFNILYSNTETLLPAIYNSTPQPDIRRRYNDPGVSAKAVADILERAISYSLDQYDFDAVMRAVGFDAVGPGRGVARVRYVPKVVGPDQSVSEEGEEAESGAYENVEHNETNPPEAGEQIVSQLVTTEYVPWKNFRRGPGLIWDDVEWIAFKHYLTRNQIKDLNPAAGKAITLDYDVRTGEEDKEKAEGAKDPSEIFLRACVWEVWDKTTGRVLFIAPCYEAGPIKVEDDPLQLTGFFPIPRPLQPINTPCDLVPVPLYRGYKDLAEELNEVTIRIKRLVRQIRVRGIYASSAADIEQIIKGDDGELIAAQGLELFADGGLDKAIAWWPIEPQVKALAQLVEHREAIKQTIYEVTGLSDILRGASAASETATAQNIKNQWGSLRIQGLQSEVQRFCRDIFRMKAELIGQNFEMPLLMEMTGVKLASQADKALAQQQMQQMQMQAQQMAMMAQQQGQQPPQPPEVPDELKQVMEAPLAEEVEQIMRSDLMRSYRIDVETDSTVRADLTRNMEQMTNFVQGSGAYIQGVIPGIQAGIIPPDLAITVFGAFARNFRLGRQVDMALEKAAEEAAELAKNPPPPPPDPAMVKAQADAQAKQQDAQLAREKQDADLQFMQRKAELEAQITQQKAEADIQIAYAKANADMQIKSMQAEKQAEVMDNKNQIQTAQAAQGMQQDAEMHDVAIQQARSGNFMAAERHALEMEGAQAEGQRADEKHRAMLAAQKAKSRQKPN